MNTANQRLIKPILTKNEASCNKALRLINLLSTQMGDKTIQ